MKKQFLVLAFLIPLLIKGQNLYVSTSSAISFFSEAPLENIQAINKDAKSLINASNNEIVMLAGIRGFKFENAIMEDHFNENYMESDKYKTAIFKGKINEEIDFGKDGVYDVTATGEMEVHGVKQERLLTGTVTVKGNVLTLNSTFDIALKDHNIKIPQVLIKNIAEVVEVNALINYKPK